MNWWLAKGQQTEGPFPQEHVVDWLRTGQIRPDAMACPEGGREWKRLSELNAFADCIVRPPEVSQQPPPPPPVDACDASTGALGLFGARYRAKFGILTAAVILGGAYVLMQLLLIGDLGEGPVALYLLMLAIRAGNTVTTIVFHYRVWKLIPAQFAETTPGKAVGYLFIPFFNFYWAFTSFAGLNRSLNRFAEARGLTPPRLNVGMGTAVAVFIIASNVFSLVSLGLPDVADIETQYYIQDQADYNNAYEDVAAQVAGFDLLTLLVLWIPFYVVWLLMVLEQKRMVEHLLKHGAPVDAASGLLEANR